MSKSLDNIEGCAVSIKDKEITILIRGKDFYKKLEFKNKRKLTTSNLTKEEYVKTLENCTEFYYGTKD